ncbi:penicillin-binding protein [Rhodanobacter glycinis]|uniref:peptidoglycan glycosyltransferase n=1 Tax=Rhodanobacter glycinis TaxID=582702 RepID=A0A5B9DX74_9GAMM|nr:transglycosylase domain-containing protein [Rhodanobacter glycinis]QEE23191.1 penicillin-binding protein [Rhodanobacter glycinis]
MRRWLTGLAALAVAAAVALAVATWRALPPLPATLVSAARLSAPLHFVAADGTPLNRSYRGRFNRVDALPAWRIPALLRTAFVASEDQRYWQHGGVDWRARFAALWENLRAGQVQRGASTIGEQAARILQPRPHTYWSHWIAGIEAGRLLRHFGHAQVLDFYLNQVPYGARRRGVAPAAHYYFGRDPDALDPAEQLSLAVLVRSPSRYDPRRHPQALRQAVDQLAGRMRASGAIDATQAEAIRRAPIQPGQQALAVEAGPFVLHAAERARALGLTGPVLKTTLDPDLQRFVQQVLDQRVRTLATRGVRNAAALVVDNATGAVLAWVVAPQDGPFAIDAVLAPRQPGSTLKPFVYGLAMARLGWQPDTVIEDTPLAENVREGLHRYRNYSGRYYGKVSLRYALANSLNIPAVKTAQAVGVPTILDLLHRLGFGTFDQTADFYGPAIVLGDGGVRLFDLVQGYASLARHGRYLPLHVLADTPQPDPVPVLPAPVTSLLASILSDPNARSAEFGADSVLDLPMPTAVKTGTSSDYRDIWTMGFDDRYTVGVWMGRLDGGSTDGLTGSSGPAPVLRQIFARLRTAAPYAGLWHSPALQPVHACEWIGPPPCVQRDDWHLGDVRASVSAPSTTTRRVAIARPLPGEMLAIDPRLPAATQRYRFSLDTAGQAIRRVVWQLDGKPLATTTEAATSWQIVPGPHTLSARVWLDGGNGERALNLGPVAFSVLGQAPPHEGSPE